MSDHANSARDSNTGVLGSTHERARDARNSAAAHTTRGEVDRRVTDWENVPMGKDVGFWVEAPGGALVACFLAFHPELGCDEGGDLEVFLCGDSQAAVKERARELGIPYPGLKRDKEGNWVKPEDVQAAVSSEDGAVWRRRREWDPPGLYRDIKDWPGTYEQRRR